MGQRNAHLFQKPQPLLVRLPTRMAPLQRRLIKLPVYIDYPLVHYCFIKKKVALRVSMKLGQWVTLAPLRQRLTELLSYVALYIQLLAFIDTTLVFLSAHHKQCLTSLRKDAVNHPGTYCVKLASFLFSSANKNEKTENKTGETKKPKTTGKNSNNIKVCVYKIYSYKDYDKSITILFLLFVIQ